MVAMSKQDRENNDAGSDGSAGENEGVLPVDFDELATEVFEGMQGLKLLQSKSGWSAITLPLKEMPGEGVSQTLGALFSGGPVGFEAINKSLDFLKLAIIESTETEGGAKLQDLAFGEWMDLLEQWANS